MKIKRIAVLTALILLISALSLSLTVFAVPTEIESTQPSSEPDSAQDAESFIRYLSPYALTPNGQGTVLDYYENEDDDKQFYTITTPSGNVFYLIVDGARGAQNVYFLNTVTESDLMALAEKDDDITISAIPSTQSCSCADQCKSGKINEDCPVCKADITKCTGRTASTADEAVVKGTSAKAERSSDNGNMMLYGIVAAAFIIVAGVGIVIKIVRPKKQQSSFDEEEDEDYIAAEYGSPSYLPEDDYDDE